MDVEKQDYGKVVRMEDTTDKDSGSSFTNCIASISVIGSTLLFVITFPFSLFFCFVMVWEFQRAVIFRLGRVREHTRGPGLIFNLPCIDEVHKVDLRIITYEVEKQELLTKDAVTVLVDAVVFHRVEDPLKATIEVANSAKSTKFLAASILRKILGTKQLHEILCEREAIAEEIKNHLDEATHPWGIVVEIVEIKDVSLPVQLQRAMATEAEKSREARAKIISAEGEKQASIALKQASDVISSSKAALELRYLQTLGVIAHENSSIVVLPIPGEIMHNFSNNYDSSKATPPRATSSK